MPIQTCPVNGRSYQRVPTTTVLHHVKQPWNLSLQVNYYFCHDPQCPVVYFSAGNTIEKDKVRTPVGLKEASQDSMACYCFGISKQDYCNNVNIQDFIVKQTKDAQCACRFRNPSGRCCLGEVAQWKASDID